MVAFAVPLFCVLLKAAWTEAALDTCMVICIITQLIFLYFEIVAAIAVVRLKTLAEIVEEEYINVIEIGSIFYSFVYCSMRIRYSHLRFNYDDATKDALNKTKA